MSPSAGARSEREAAPRPRGEEVVRTRGLTKRFPVRRTWAESLRDPLRRDLVTAVSDLSLSVMAGEFFGLLGPNGAGKTTLFKMLATLMLPDDGSASVAGHDVAGAPAAVRRVLTPVIADERSLMWRLSAWENMRLFAGLYGIGGSERDRRISDILEVVGLGETAEKLVGSFSSGMKQRLLIGRALLGRPRVLLLDEPTRSLDPVSARRFRQFLREEIVQAQGCAVMLATHNAEEALELCDRVAVLSRGRLLALGPVEEMIARIGDDDYLLCASLGAERTLEALHRRGLVRDYGETSSGPGSWTSFRLQIPGGADQAAAVLASLVGEKHAISRFERVALSLADLLERTLESGEERESSEEGGNDA
jgi:ABC-2 type transport system ATP-binding protein